jgi:hypothetical protein
MTKRPRFYLAHPILDRDWVRKEELRLEKKFNLDLANPFYDEKERNDIKEIDAGKIMPYGIQLVDKIVFGDIDKINKSKGILGFVTSSVSVGTFMELFYNAWVLRHPAYIIVTNKNLQTHPWLRFCARYGRIFKSLPSFERWWEKKHGHR